MTNSFEDSFRQSFQGLWDGVITFIPKLFWAVIIFVIGALLGHYLGKAVSHIVRAIKLDALIEKVGAKKYFDRANIRLDIGAFIGAIVQWFIIVVFAMESLKALNLIEVTAFLKTVIGYVPQVFVAVIILLIGLVIGEFLDRVVGSASKAANFGRSRLLGTATRWAVWVFAVLVALYQLGIAAVFSEVVFNGIITALSISVGLAFGLGGQEHASDFIRNLRHDVNDKNHQ